MFTEMCFHIPRIFRVNIVGTVVNLVISCSVAKRLNMRELTSLEIDQTVLGYSKLTR